MQFIVILAFSCKKESNFALLDQKSEKFQFHSGSSTVNETYRLRLSEDYSVIITACVDSNGIVTLSDSIVSAIASDKYAFIDLRAFQLEAPGNPVFDSVKVKILYLNDQNNSLVDEEIVAGLATGTPTHEIYCECTAGENHQYCNPTTSGNMIYCDASPMFCLYCTLGIIWDDERIGSSSQTYSAIILNY